MLILLMTGNKTIPLPSTSVYTSDNENPPLNQTSTPFGAVEMANVVNANDSIQYSWIDSPSMDSGIKTHFISL